MRFAVASKAQKDHVAVTKDSQPPFIGQSLGIPPGDDALVQVVGRLPTILTDSHLLPFDDVAPRFDVALGVSQDNRIRNPQGHQPVPLPLSSMR